MIWAIAACVGIIPIILWGIESPTYSIYGLGQIAALVGISLFAFNIFLSGRFKWFERVFGPINRITIYHHLIGICVWILFLVHPILLTSSYGLQLLLPTISPWTQSLGQLAFLGLNSLIILSLFIKLPYHIWRYTHKFLGVVYVIGLIHALFIPSGVFVLIKIYIVCTALIALATYIYRTVYGKILVPRSLYTVTSVKSHADITEIELTAQNKPLIHEPGQFIFISFDAPGFTEAHPFSITSQPNNPTLNLSAKNSGDYTKLLPQLPLDTTAHVEGPFGRFSYAFHTRKNMIWIAGGIGITPFLSMASTLPKSNYQVTLYYVVKTKPEATYTNLLQRLYNKNLSVIVHESEKSGRFTSDILAKNHSNLTQQDIYICGPLPMMKSLRSQLNQLGIRHSHIFTEEFSLT